MRWEFSMKQFLHLWIHRVQLVRLVAILVRQRVNRRLPMCEPQETFNITAPSE